MLLKEQIIGQKHELLKSAAEKVIGRTPTQQDLLSFGFVSKDGKEYITHNGKILGRIKITTYGSKPGVKATLIPVSVLERVRNLFIHAS